MKKIFSLAILVGWALALEACGDRVGGAPKRAPAAAAAAPAQQVLPISLPPKVAHEYVVRDGQEYGYEPAISENQRSSGQAAAEIRMFSYLGRKGDVYQVMLKDDNVRSVVECEKPCDFGKIYTFVGDRFVRKDTVRLAPDAIASAAVRDAMRGELNPLRGEQRGKATSFWVDGSVKRLIVGDAETSGVVK